jgi:hypothetical protein
MSDKTGAREETTMHYANGREAKVGDQVVGRTCNVNGKMMAGTLVTLTPGGDQCSAKVGYLHVVPLANIRVVRRLPGVVRVQGTELHGMGGVMAATLYCEDYTYVAKLLHADDVAQDGGMLAAPSGQ